MASRTVLIGYSDTGRVAVDVLSAALTPPDLVVVDVDPDRVELVLQRGVTAVLGNGADLGTLFIADVPDADRVIVAVADDASAMRIIAAVRTINTATTIIVLVREPRWRETAAQLGADKVIVAKQIVGRLLGLSVRQVTGDLP